MNTVNVAGEQITVSEAAELTKMMYEDAKQVAGEFHNMERSAKFRLNWPDETLFAESEWKNFVEAVRQMYAAKLGDPKTKSEDARKMHLAIVLQDMMGEGQEKDHRLQLMPGTQQYHGDKYENRKIVENYGMKPNFRAALRNGAAKILKTGY